MRRPLALCAAVLAVGCAKTEQQADSTPPAAVAAPAPVITLGDLAGTWEGQIMAMDKDSVVTTATLINTATMDGWSMKLPNGAAPAVKVVTVEGDSVVTTAGPFASVLRKGQQVSTHSIMHMKDGKLVGVIHAKYPNGDTATLRITATRKP
jgi:type IV pilus biogenesis protein CpaD/CtpE